MVGKAIPAMEPIVSTPPATPDPPAQQENRAVPIPKRDAELVAAIRRGDQGVIERLVEEWASPMLHLARGYVRSDAVAEEAVQETWLAVMKGIEGFEGRSTLKSWVFSILINRAKTIAVREARTTPFSDLEKEENPEALDPADAALFGPDGTVRPEAVPTDAEWSERLARSAEARAALERALDELPPIQRAVVVMTDVEQMSSPDISEALGISEANRRVLLHRARMKLRRALHEHAPEGT